MYNPPALQTLTLLLGFSGFLHSATADDTKGYEYYFTNPDVCPPNAQQLLKPQKGLEALAPFIAAEPYAYCLIYLIQNTQAIDDHAKQDWIDRLPTMTSAQSLKLFTILADEMVEIKKVDSEYQQSLEAMNKPYRYQFVKIPSVMKPLQIMCSIWYQDTDPEQIPYFCYLTP